jgi:hypothetical protein
MAGSRKSFQHVLRVALSIKLQPTSCLGYWLKQLLNVVDRFQPVLDLLFMWRPRRTVSG